MAHTYLPESELRPQSSSLRRTDRMFVSDEELRRQMGQLHAVTTFSTAESPCRLMRPLTSTSIPPVEKACKPMLRSATYAAGLVPHIRRLAAAKVRVCSFHAAGRFVGRWRILMRARIVGGAAALVFPLIGSIAHASLPQDACTIFYAEGGVGQHPYVCIGSCDSGECKLQATPGGGTF